MTDENVVSAGRAASAAISSARGSAPSTARACLLACADGVAAAASWAVIGTAPNSSRKAALPKHVVDVGVGVHHADEGRARDPA